MNDEGKFVFTMNDDDDTTIIFKAELICSSFSKAFANNFYKLLKEIINDKDYLLDSIEDDELDDELSELVEGKNWGMIVSKTEKYESNFGELSPYHIYLKALAYNKLNNFTQSIRLCDRAEQIAFSNLEKEHFYDLDPEYLSFYASIYYVKASNLSSLNEKYQAHWYYNIAEKYLPRNEDGQLHEVHNDIHNKINKSFAFFAENLLAQPYLKRRLILPLFELPASIPENLIPVKIGYKNPINFSTGEPIEGEIYVAHPFINDKYYLIQEYESQIFEAQVLELKYLLACLGAVTIKIKRIYGKSILEISSANNEKSATTRNELKGSGSIRIHSTEATSASSRNATTKHSNNDSDYSLERKEMTSETRLTPNRPPFIPNDLIWYSSNETWQSIAKARLNGNILKEKLTLSTKNIKQISVNEFKSVQEEVSAMFEFGYKNLVIEGKFKKKSELYKNNIMSVMNYLQEKSETLWEIDIDFAPIEVLKKGKFGKTIEDEINSNIPRNKNIPYQVNVSKSILRGQRIKIEEIIPDFNELEIFSKINAPKLTIDFSCFGLDLNGQLSDDRYMIFFNQPSTPCGAITINNLTDNSANFKINFKKLPSKINQLVFTAAIDGFATMSEITNGYVGIMFNQNEVARFSFIGSDFLEERALILLTIYFKQNAWRTSAIGQGFNGGLEQLVHHFGGTTI